MKRSEINEAILLAVDFMQAYRFQLPKWATWRQTNWEHCGPEAEEIRKCALGWEISDFGRGRFGELGALRFVLRRGDPARGNQRKPYEETISLAQVQQVMPMHCHLERMQDIINRGGGDVVVQVQMADATGRPDDKNRVPVSVNGIIYNLKPGGLVRLAPGDSITLRPGIYHKYWAERAGALVGVVGSSASNPPDCRYLEDLAWETEIEDDEPPVHLLSHEYPEFE